MSRSCVTSLGVWTAPALGLWVAVALTNPALGQQAEGDTEVEQRDGERKPGGKEKGIQPYEKVITEEAQSDEGVFMVHWVKDKLYYEIPESELEQEFLPLF